MYKRNGFEKDLSKWITLEPVLSFMRLATVRELSVRGYIPNDDVLDYDFKPLDTPIHHKTDDYDCSTPFNPRTNSVAIHNSILS
jgi:hypothetical protein